MPLYEYLCESCGKTIEVIQKFADAPLSECEACGGTLEKLLSRSTVQFKGTGWYVTDYADKGKKAGNSSNTKAKKPGTEGKSEKAPDTGKKKSAE